MSSPLHTPSLGFNLLGIQDVAWGQLLHANMLGFAQASGNVVQGALTTGVQVGYPATLEADGSVVAGWTTGLRGTCTYADTDTAEVTLCGAVTVVVTGTTPPSAGNYVAVSGTQYVVVTAADIVAGAVLGVIDGVDGAQVHVSAGVSQLPSAAHRPSASWVYGLKTTMARTRTVACTVQLGPTPEVLTSVGADVTVQLSGSEIRVNWPGAFTTAPVVSFGFTAGGACRGRETVLNKDYVIAQLFNGSAPVAASASVAVMHIIAHGGV